MRNTGLINLPDSFGNLTELGFLRLDGNNLVSLPKTIGNLEILHMIILDDNPHLRSLQSLNGIRNLRYIHAQNCVIDRLPYDAPNLVGLLMVKNRLTDLYGIETLGYNTSASKEFAFNSNRISYIPPEIRQSYAEITSKKQPALDCSLYDDDYDVLLSFPFHVDILINTEHSSTTYASTEIENQINSLVIKNENVLPLTVFCLKHLKYFNILNSSIIPYFSDNDTDYQFPSEIESLAASLTIFVVMDTKVTHLPEEIGKLNLRHLEMINTGIIDLPDSIGNLTELPFL